MKFRDMGQKKKLSDHPSHPSHTSIRQYKLAGRLVPRDGRSDGLSTVRARLGTARARLATVRARLLKNNLSIKKLVIIMLIYVLSL